MLKITSGRSAPSAAARLAPGGRLIVEVGYDQDDRVAAIEALPGHPGVAEREVVLHRIDGIDGDAPQQRS